MHMAESVRETRAVYKSLRAVFFFTETFWSLKHIGAFKLSVAVFISNVFTQSNQNHLIFFSHFENMSVYDLKNNSASPLIEN